MYLSESALAKKMAVVGSAQLTFCIPSYGEPAFPVNLNRKQKAFPKELSLYSKHK